jgi:hypothetical protein
MNETKSNIFLNEISNNLTKVSNNILKMKPLIVTLRFSQIKLQKAVDLDLSTSEIIGIAEEKLNVCINGCLSFSASVNGRSNKVSIIEQYRKNILHPLDGVMAILIVIQNSLKSDLLWLKEGVNIDNKLECISAIESIIKTANMIVNMLNEKISESLYMDFNRLKDSFVEELESVEN